MSDAIDELYARIDQMDLAGTLSHFAPDGAVVFANNPPAVGTDGIGAALGQFWGLLGGLRHERSNRWDIIGGTVLLEADVHYETIGGTHFVCPVVTVIDRSEDGKVTSMRIHIDVSSVVAQALSELPTSTALA